MDVDPDADTAAGPPATPAADATLTATPDRRGAAGEPATRYGTFRVAGLLGRGGMGVVYRAVDEVLGREVALKVVGGRDLGTAGRHQLLREARALAALQHRNVCAVYQAGETAGEVFIAMERLPGPTLTEVIAAGPRPLTDVLRHARDIAAGLAHAHAAGLVHRDLKPGNVMCGVDGEAKLVDFGLARAMDAIGEAAPSPVIDTVGGASTETRVAGTPRYMAPEQLEGGAIDARTDVWAFGLILHELLTGAHPFASLDTPALLEAIRTGSPALRLRSPRVPPALGALVRACLAREPAARPADGAALVARLDAIAAGGRGRRRWLVASAALVVAAATVAIARGRGSAPPDRLAQLARSVTAELRLDRAEDVYEGDGEVLPLGPDRHLIIEPGKGFSSRRVGGRSESIRPLDPPWHAEALLVDGPDRMTALASDTSAGNRSTWRSRGERSLWRLDARTGTWTALPAAVRTRRDDRAAITSPDDAWIAVAGDRHLRVLDARSGAVVAERAVEAGARLSGDAIAWGPDSRWVAYVVLRPGPARDSVELLTIATRRTRELLGGGEYGNTATGGASLTAVDGGLVVVDRAHADAGRARVVLVTVDEPAQHQVIAEVEDGGLGLARVAGTWWLLRSRTAEHVQLRAADGRSPLDLAEYPQLVTLGWADGALHVRSPGGVMTWNERTGLVAAPSVRVAQVWGDARLVGEGGRLRLETPAGARVLPIEPAREGFACAADLSWCVVAPPEPELPVRWFATADLVAHEGMALSGDLVLAPAGRPLVAHTAPDAVVVADLETRSTRRYDAGMRQPQSMAFARDGRALYVAGMFGEAAVYMVTRIELATGAVEIITSSAGAWFSRPSVGPDGTLAVVVRRFITEASRVPPPP